MISLIDYPVVHSEESAQLNKTKHILYINSYHEGYKWSDDIYHTVKATLDSSAIDVTFDALYLDTQRIMDISLDDYYMSIANAYRHKFETEHPDMIVASDDAAFQFVQNYLTFVSPDIPVLYCGVNDYDSTQQPMNRPSGGIIEKLSFVETFQLIQTLDEEVKEVYYIVDNTLTGKAIETYILNEYDNLNTDVVLKKLSGNNMDDILFKVTALPKDSALMFFVFFQDSEENYYNYKEGISLVAGASKVPVYSLWDFAVGQGVLGGKVLSGQNQGRRLADEIIEYFTDENYTFRTITTDENKYVFDYDKLQEYGISLEEIPYNSDIINFTLQQKKNILLLSSYSYDFKWTRDIVLGIEEGLSLYEGDIEYFYEAMDLKREDDLQYINEYKQAFMYKHEKRKFDLIITSDDGAFEFAKEILDELANEPPLVFCGVNYMTEEEQLDHENYTGVMESYDLEETIHGILTIQPGVKSIFVINDTTATGLNNKNNVEQVKDKFPELEFVCSDDQTMNELLDYVATLPEDYAILLLSYNRDRANNYFSYTDSAKMLKSKASVPMYGVWDFYLGTGVMGGYLTNGFAQGYTAGTLGVRILEGESVSDLEVITESPNSYRFDLEVMNEFGITQEMLPPGSQLINEPDSLWDVYHENQYIFNGIFVLIFMILVITFILFYFLRESIVKNKTIQELAMIDHLTNIMNRRTGLEKLYEKVNNKRDGTMFCIIFIDINNLKDVNDMYGHNEGDELILAITNGIQKHLLQEDIFCRMGGDEFMIAFESTGDESRENIIQEIKTTLEKMTNHSHKPYEYSISAGMHRFVAKAGVNINDMIEIADTAMYADKSLYKSKQ
jgi:diguanylate cyclase (GGDEF)-like protein